VKHIRERCDGWGALEGGDLIFSGMSRFETNTQTWAITGGTGIYQTARGQILLHNSADRSVGQSARSVERRLDAGFGESAHVRFSAVAEHVVPVHSSIRTLAYGPKRRRMKKVHRAGGAFVHRLH
jgi:hypothetical protein